MDQPPLYTLVPQRRGIKRWPGRSTTVRAVSPSPMEPRLGRMFQSSATGRRRGAILPDQSRGCQACWMSLRILLREGFPAPVAEFDDSFRDEIRCRLVLDRV